MNDTALDLTPSPVLLRAADVIDTHGHAKDDFYKDGYCAAGAIAEACELTPEDWFDDHSFAPANSETYDVDLQAWMARRQAALDALRTLLGHVRPDSRPEEMSRDALIVKVGDWNDADTRTGPEVAAALRAAARQAQP